MAKLLPSIYNCHFIIPLASTLTQPVENSEIVVLILPKQFPPHPSPAMDAYPMTQHLLLQSKHKTYHSQYIYLKEHMQTVINEIYM